MAGYTCSGNRCYLPWLYDVQGQTYDSSSECSGHRGDSQKAEELNKDFCKYAGIDEKDGIIRIQANIPEDGGSLSSKTALTTLLGADAVDVLICREDVYQEYKKQDGFQETIDFPEDNMLKKKKIISYDDAHAAIMVNAQNQKMAEKFISYLEQLNHINNAN